MFLFKVVQEVYYQFSSSKLDDRKYLESILQDEKKFLNSQIMFVADKGYQAAWLEQLAKETGNYLLTGKKKSKKMKVLASQWDIYLLHIRARIESMFSNLKQNCFLTNTRSRSVLATYSTTSHHCIFDLQGVEVGFAIWVYLSCSEGNFYRSSS